MTQFAQGLGFDLSNALASDGERPANLLQLTYPDHFATEPDNTYLYVPKGQMDTTSMQKTRFQIPPEIYGPVRNHAVVALTTSANIVDRRRSLAQRCYDNNPFETLSTSLALH